LRYVPWFSSVVQSDHRLGRGATSSPSEERQPGFSDLSVAFVSVLFDGISYVLRSTMRLPPT
jgi:hypothetical protein